VKDARTRSSEMAHPFIVGETYLDRRGEYEVRRVDGSRMTIRYADGKEETADVAIKARIYQNILSEQTSLHPHQSEGYFETLAFLAKSAEFQAEVPPQSQANFEEKYFMLTGARPQVGRDGYFPISIVTTYDKWGPELRIYFPDSGRRLEFPSGVDVRGGHAPGMLRINNNDFWWKLVRVGFRLGSRHDVSTIRASIPPKYVTAFDAGR
jgi:hypothetical protein